MDSKKTHFVEIIALMVGVVIFVTACLSTHPIYHHQIKQNGDFGKSYDINIIKYDVVVELSDVRTTEGVGGFHITGMDIVIHNNTNQPILFITENLKLDSKYYDYSYYRVWNLEDKEAKHIAVPPTDIFHIDIDFADTSATYDFELLEQRMPDQWLELYLPGLVVEDDTIALPLIKMIPEVALEQK